MFAHLVFVEPRRRRGVRVVLRKEGLATKDLTTALRIFAKRLALFVSVNSNVNASVTIEASGELQSSTPL
jgi:hypothetical protein